MRRSVVLSAVSMTRTQNVQQRLLAVIAPIVVGCGIAAITTIMLVTLRPILVAAVFCGIAVFLPTLVLRETKVYWLVLFVLSMQFDISKRLTTWMAAPWLLFEKYGLPASGNLSINFYISDAILCILILPWVCKLLLRQEKLFFPALCYIPLVYFGWTGFSSLMWAVSPHLSFFEWVRQFFYFFSLVYIINNITSIRHVRWIIFTLTVAILMQASIALIAFQFQTSDYLFSGLYRERTETGSKPHVGPSYVSEEKPDSGDRSVRSRGTFAHSANAAYYFEYLVPLMLLLSFSHNNLRRRLIYISCFIIGCTALILTFSRSGFVGLLFGIGVALFLAQRRNLLSRLQLTRLVVVAIICFCILSPIVYNHLTLRPESFRFRFGLLETGIEILLKQPIFGVGLNNSSIADERFQPKRYTDGTWEVEVIHNHYLIIAIETGMVGFVLYFSFFGLIMRRAWQCAKSPDQFIATFSLGMLGSLASIALHNMGDPFGGHTLHAMLWLYAGLILALQRIDNGQLRTQR